MPIKPIINYNFSVIAIILVFFFAISLSLYTSSGIFIYGTLIPYFSLTLGSGIIGFLTLVSIYKEKRDVTIHSALIPAAFLILFVLYQQARSGVFTYKQHYLLAGLFLFFYLFFLFVFTDIRRPIFLLILAVGGVECLICLLQHFQLFPTYNYHFAVTGTWQNPNVTAMFLAMTLPILLSHLSSINKKSYLVLLWVLLIAFLSSLYLLNCRSAWLGGFISSLLFLNYRYNIWSKCSKGVLFWFFSVLFFLAVVCPAFKYLYTVKQASSDGRIFIWKRSFEVALNNPITGHNYGMFERVYNLHQSSFFNRGLSSTIEKRNADHILTAYNEVLENFVEGGLIGVFLVGGILYFVLSNPFKDTSSEMSPDKNIFFVACSSLWAYIIMSTVNFTVSATPVFWISIVYTSFICSYHVINTNGKGSYLNVKLSKGLLVTIILCSSIYLVSYSIKTIRAQRALMTFLEYKNGHKFSKAKAVIYNYRNFLYNSSPFYTYYGDLHFSLKDYYRAIDFYFKASQLTSTTEIFEKLGICYMNVGQYQMAEKNLRIAIGIEPNSLFSKRLLLEIFLKDKSWNKAKSLAIEIINLRPKVNSRGVTAQKQFAYHVLQTLPTETIHN